MVSMKKWMLAAALAIGGLGLAAAPANAAVRVGVVVGGPAYVPPCPGAGYVWVAGYYANGYWVPGYWNFIGVRVGVPVVRGRVVFDRGPVIARRVGPDRGYDHFRR
ncbi:MAG TPA: hypothetical protein VMA34_14085 [Terracidiphilus sp.]|nr:hypothetical protein [Terracidiphilus sp.]